jgi:hypothetical protein
MSVIWVFIVFLGLFFINYLKNKYNKKNIKLLLINILGLILLISYKSIFISSIYHLDDFLPNRMSWHSAYLGLAVNPDWNKKYGQEHLNAGGDAIAWNATTNYIRNKLGIYDQEKINAFTLSPLSTTYRFGMHEKIIKTVYIDFIKNDPIFFIKTFLYWKPIVYLKNIYEYIIEVLIKNYKILTVFMVLTYIVLIKFGKEDDGSDSKQLKRLLLLSLVGFLGVSMPPIWAFPAKHTMSEQFLLFGFLTVMCCVFIASTLLFIASSYKHKTISLYSFINLVEIYKNFIYFNYKKIIYTFVLLSLLIISFFVLENSKYINNYNSKNEFNINNTIKIYQLDVALQNKIDLVNIKLTDNLLTKGENDNGFTAVDNSTSGLHRFEFITYDVKKNDLYFLSFDYKYKDLNMLSIEIRDLAQKSYEVVTLNIQSNSIISTKGPIEYKNCSFNSVTRWGTCVFSIRPADNGIVSTFSLMDKNGAINYQGDGFGVDFRNIYILKEKM